MTMDSRNFVSPNPNGGFDVFFNGSYYTTTATQDEAQNLFNQLTQGGGGGPFSGTYAPMDLLNWQLGMANQEYLRQRLQLVDVPMLELEKHRLAFQKAESFAQLSGWIIPSEFLSQSLAQQFAGTGIIPPSVDPNDMANIRQQLQGAGWPGGNDTEAVQAFQEIAGNDPTQTDLVGRIQQTAPTGGGYPSAMPQGAQPTLGMSGLLAEPRNMSQSLSMTGLNPQQTLGGMPRAQGLLDYPGIGFPGQPGGGGGGTPGMLPSMELMGILGDPRTMVQGLSALGNSPQQIASLLQSSPLVQGLLQGTYGGGRGVYNPPVGIPPGGSYGELPIGPNPIPAPGVLPPGYAPPASIGGPGQYGQISPSRAATMAGFNAPPRGLIPQGREGTRNPLFPFVSGRHIPVQQGRDWLTSNSQMVPLISGLASYSGQNPLSFWGDFQQYLPKGGPVPLTSYA